MNCPDCGCGLTEDTTRGYYKSVSNPDPHQEASRMAKKEQERQEREQAIKDLREIFPPGSTVHTSLLHTSRSGMERVISVIAVVDGEPRNISWQVARATGDKMHPKYDGIKMGGCGMDMGHHLAYSLSRTLYRDDFTCLGTENARYADRCPSNDHANEREPNYTPGRVHSDGGYALRHRWL